MNKRRILWITIACACTAPPAMADLFNFGYGSLQSSYNGSTFTATYKEGFTFGNVTRIEPPEAVAVFYNFGWNTAVDKKNFLVNLTVTNVTATTADASGTFKITGSEGDVIQGNIDNGVWANGAAPTFRGDLSNVTFTDTGNDGMFKGDTGAIPMTYSVEPPWSGILIELTGHNQWFQGKTWRNVLGGSVDATAVPLPGAVLLGLLGLAAAGTKLRKAV